MCGELVPCSLAIISGYAAWFCVGVSIGGVPYHHGLGLDGNDPLLLLWLYSFILCVVSVLHSGTSSLIWGGVLIRSPWYVLEVFLWETVGLILFSGVCT